MSVLVEDLIYIGSIRSTRKWSIVKFLIFNCPNIAYYIRTYNNAFLASWEMISRCPVCILHKPCLFQPSLPQARSVSEIAAELSRSTSSLQGSLGSDSISRSGSSASLPSLTTSRFDCKSIIIKNICMQCVLAILK